METLLWWLLMGFIALLGGWLVLSPIICMWWLLNPGSGTDFGETHEGIATVIYVGGIISFFSVLTAGLDRCLFFIPDNWGQYIGGANFIRASLAFAFPLGFVSTCCFGYIFSKYEQVYEENRRLSMVAECHKRTGKLKCWSRYSLVVQKRDEVAGELQRLLGGPDEREVSAKEEREIEILYLVLGELELQIQELDAIDGLDDALDEE